MKKITLYCPTYNSIKYIDGYLKNINEQIFKNFNIIFVDGGSIDGSLEKIKNFNFDENINVKIIEKKSSVYEAWNIAVENINTEYCMNFNTDDRLMPNALEIYNYYINKYDNIDLFYGMHYFISNLEDLEILDISYQWQSLINQLNKKSENDLYFNINPCGPFPLVKTESLKKSGKFDTKYFSSADYDMWLRMYSSGYKFKRLDESLGYFLYRSNSISQERLSESESHDIEIQKKYKK